MKKSVAVLGFVLGMNYVQQSAAQCLPDAKVNGFASLNGGVTGGEGGASVVVENIQDFNTQAKKTEALVIYVKGTLSGTAIIGTTNKTVYGYKGAKIQGNLVIYPGAKNVIVRNLIVRGNLPCPGDCQDGLDAVSITGGGGPDVPADIAKLPAPVNIWLDHMDIADGQDGNCDLKRGVDNVTISWTKFSYTKSKEHAFSNLIGHDDGNSAQDNGKLNTTFDHCWWADNIVERQPRVRFGKVHVVNSLLSSSKSAVVYGLGVKANVLSENNVIKAGGTFAGDYGDYTAFESRNNSGKSNSKLGGTVFTPPYSLTKESTGSLEASVKKCAGATLDDPITTGFEEVELPTTPLAAAPNPFSQQLFVDLPEHTPYQLMDIQGKVIRSGTGKAFLYTEDLLPGIYLLKWQTGSSRSETLKLQKNH